MATNKKTQIPEALSALADMATADLRREWQTVFGVAAPTVRREILIFALGHALQERQLGGLAKRSQKQLQQWIEPSANPIQPTRLPAGTRLVREWRGRTHAVEVQADGYVWDGQRFDSLSAIARAITGTRWSGPRFFGTQSPSYSVNETT